MNGTVLRIEKCSIHDGDGLRTVVFLKGCMLRCDWCAAPESQEAEIAHGYGKIMSVAEVMNEVAKDEVFYFHSNGGLTISGGEPLFQPDFTLDLLRSCKKIGINTAIETAAYGDYQTIEKLLPHLDMIYADIKHIANDEHVKHIGVPNDMILDNIRHIAHSFSNLRVRIPLIPSFNMAESQIRDIARFCKSLNNLEFVEFLPFHRLGIGMYLRLGRESPPYRPPTKEEIIEAKEIFLCEAPSVIIKEQNRALLR